LIAEIEASVAKVQEHLQKKEMSEDEGEKSCDTKETNEMALGVVLGVEGLRMMDL
jgi:hypothetical protein